MALGIHTCHTLEKFSFATPDGCVTRGRRSSSTHVMEPRLSDHSHPSYQIIISSASKGQSHFIAASDITEKPCLSCWDPRCKQSLYSEGTQLSPQAIDVLYALDIAAASKSFQRIWVTLWKTLGTMSRYFTVQIVRKAIAAADYELLGVEIPLGNWWLICAFRLPSYLFLVLGLKTC